MNIESGPHTSGFFQDYNMKKGLKKHSSGERNLVSPDSENNMLSKILIFGHCFMRFGRQFELFHERIT